MSDEDQTDEEVQEPAETDTPEPESTDPEPRKWWIGTPLGGRPTFVEIVQINDTKIENDEDEPPEFGYDDELTIDRGVFITQVVTPQGPGPGFMDIRNMFGPCLIPTDMDVSDLSSRTPLKIKGRSLFAGPYLWLVYGDPAYQIIWDEVANVYRPITDEEREEAKQAQQRPEILGASGQPAKRPSLPGAMGAMGHLG